METYVYILTEHYKVLKQSHFTIVGVFETRKSANDRKLKEQSENKNERYQIAKVLLQK